MSRSRRSSVWACRGLLALCLAAGCATGREKVDQALLADAGNAARSAGICDHYQVHCPDVLEVTVYGDLNRSGLCAVTLDGRIELGPLGEVRVEGQSVPEIRRRLAEVARVAPAAVHVRVAEYQSQHVYLSGAGNGKQRAVEYRGPETVLDLLQRVGGVQPGVEPKDAYLIRPNITEGQAPQVFTVDLRSIALKKDQRTNFRVQPFDQIYVGETKEASLLNCFPRWIQPLYKSICGLWREKVQPAAKALTGAAG